MAVMFSKFKLSFQKFEKITGGPCHYLNKNFESDSIFFLSHTLL